jgi:dual-specificity kinase
MLPTTPEIKDGAKRKLDELEEELRKTGEPLELTKAVLSYKKETKIIEITQKKTREIREIREIKENKNNIFDYPTLIFNRQNLQNLQPLKPKTYNHDQLRSICKQLFGTLAYLHDKSIIHTNVNIQNTMLDNLNLKILDLSNTHKLSFSINVPLCNIFKKDQKYVPLAFETLSCMSSYSFPVDIWASGVLLLELLTGINIYTKIGIDIAKFNNSPISFIQSRHIVNNLFKILGYPRPNELKALETMVSVYILNICGNQLNNLNQLNQISQIDQANQNNQFVLSPSYSNYSKEDLLLLDLISKTLIYNPSERITAKQALQHPYITYRIKTSDHMENMRNISIEWINSVVQSYHLSKDNFADKLLDRCIYKHYMDKEFITEENMPLLTAICLLFSSGRIDLNSITEDQIDQYTDRIYDMKQLREMKVGIQKLIDYNLL